MHHWLVRKKKHSKIEHGSQGHKTEQLQSADGNHLHLPQAGAEGGETSFSTNLNDCLLLKFWRANSIRRTSVKVKHICWTQVPRKSSFTCSTLFYVLSSQSCLKASKRDLCWWRQNHRILLEKNRRKRVCVSELRVFQIQSLWLHDWCEANVAWLLPRVLVTLWISPISTCLYYGLGAGWCLGFRSPRMWTPKCSQVPETVFRWQFPKTTNYLLSFDLLML